MATLLPNTYTAKALLAPADGASGGMSALMQQYGDWRASPELLFRRLKMARVPARDRVDEVKIFRKRFCR